MPNTGQVLGTGRTISVRLADGNTCARGGKIPSDLRGIRPKLAEFEKEGLTQREIAACIKTAHPYVNRLLRYHRFLRLVPTGTKIPEDRFRAYWRQVSSPQALKDLRGEKKKDDLAAYEQKCFRAIACPRVRTPLTG